jgi:hypothetical protein
LENLFDFLDKEVPKIAMEFKGPGNEANFRQGFLEGIRLAIKEENLDPLIKLEEGNLVGRTDARIEYFIFEFKSPGELDKHDVKTKGLDKLKQYLRTKPTEDWPKYQGLLTDGYKAAVISYHVSSKDFQYINVIGVPLPTGNELLEWNKITLYLSRIINTMSLPHLNSDTLLHNFGLSSSLAQTSLKSLWKQLNDEESEFTNILYQQWRELFALAVEFSIDNVSDDDLVELFQMKGRVKSQDEWDKAVFIIHTYYSLLLKILAVRIVDELKIAGKVSLLRKITQNPSVGMKEAEKIVPEILGNVIEKDVFSWPYSDENSPPIDEVNGIIVELAMRIEKFDVRGVNTDILRRVYQNVIPPKLRKSLGEFYTPTWAAELLLDKIEYFGEGRLLDPACGSGTFLVTSIQRILNTPGDPNDKLTKISQCVVGYDLNPIAVATSRLNYILVLVDILSSITLTNPISIPVFLSDSILIPEIKSVGLLPHFKIPTRVGVFSVPLIKDRKNEREIVEDTSKILTILRNNCKNSKEEFLLEIRKEFGAKIEEENQKLLGELHKKIYTLNIEGRDGIWASIIENFFAPTLQGRFDFVVGNPPWVIPRRTPASYTSSIRETIKNTKDDAIILESSKKDFLVLKTRSAAAEKQYFACVPFVWRALRTYTKEKGRCAFLMTSSMFSSISSGGWRKWISDYSILRIIDMTLITDIHERALCWSYIPVIENTINKKENLVDYSFCIPLNKKVGGSYDKALREFKWVNWKIKISDLPISNSRVLKSRGKTERSDSPWIIAPIEIKELINRIQKNVTSINKGFNRLGDIYPMHMGIKADEWKYYAFREKPNLEDGIISGFNLAGEKIVIEKRFLFATSVARELSPWKYQYNYAFLPIDEYGNDLSEVQIKQHPLVWEYLKSHKRILKNRAVVKKGYVNQWFGVLIPDAAKKTNKVVYRLIAKQLEASVLPRKIKIFDAESLLLPDQSIRFIPINSLDEAYYLEGLLNSTILRSITYLCVTPKGGVPYRQFMAWNVGFVPIIKYNATSKLCNEISKLSRMLSEDNTTQNNQEKLDSLVSQLYEINPTEFSLLKQHLSTMQGLFLDNEENIPEDIYDDSEE